MEGVASRQGRSSSRYALLGPSPPSFTRPVRKWKKQWVRSQVSIGNNKKPPLLCRWVPLSAADSTVEEQNPRRFRYVPIVQIEEKRKGGTLAPPSSDGTNMNTESIGVTETKGDFSTAQSEEQADSSKVFVQASRSEQNRSASSEKL